MINPGFDNSSNLGLLFLHGLVLLEGMFLFFGSKAEGRILHEIVEYLANDVQKDYGFSDSLERVTAVTDRHSAYFALHFLNHQVCLAHLLRELQYLFELDSNQKWSEQIAGLFREAIHKRNTHLPTL